MATKFYDVNFESKRVYLGDVGYFDENNYRAIRIDVSSVLSDYPSASFKVLMQRAGENHPYEKPASEVTLTDNKLTAELTETDMNKQGMLKVQVVFEWGSVTGRSNTFIAHVGDSLSSDAGDPQSPYADALQKIDEFLETGGGAISPEMIEEAVENYLTENPIEETDPTVPAWAKAASKPTYTAAEVGALPSNTKIPSALSEMTADSTHRTVTDAEKTAWNAKSNFSGSYNDLTNKPTIPAAYSLPVANASTLGGVKPVAKTEDMTQAVGVDALGALFTAPGSGGGGTEAASWKKVAEIKTTEALTYISVTEDMDGNPLSFDEAIVCAAVARDADATTNSTWAVSPSAEWRSSFNGCSIYNLPLYADVYGVIFMVSKHGDFVKTLCGKARRLVASMAAYTNWASVLMGNNINNQADSMTPNATTVLFQYHSNNENTYDLFNTDGKLYGVTIGVDTANAVKLGAGSTLEVWVR